MPALIALLVALTSVRLTRLLAKDTFPPVAAVRDRVVARWGIGSWQAYLAECPWCLGVYTAGLVTAGTVWGLDDGLPAPLLVWGASAYLAGVLVAFEPDDDDDEGA